jgi:hypothetical protein
MDWQIGVGCGPHHRTGRVIDPDSARMPLPVGMGLHQLAVSDAGSGNVRTFLDEGIGGLYDINHQLDPQLPVPQLP